MTPCPHCHAVARIDPSRTMRWRCAVCGAPVVPSDAGVRRSHAELGTLVAAHRTGAMAVGWMAAAFVLGAIAVMLLVLAILLGAWLHAAAILIALLAGLAGTLAAVSARRSRARTAEVRALLDDAWWRVAGEVLAARGAELTAPELARAMRTDLGHAESLLARLSAEGRARVSVRDDAELSYRVEEPQETSAEEQERGGRTGRLP